MVRGSCGWKRVVGERGGEMYVVRREGMVEMGRGGGGGDGIGGGRQTGWGVGGLSFCSIKAT